MEIEFLPLVMIMKFPFRLFAANLNTQWIDYIKAQTNGTPVLRVGACGFSMKN